MRAILIAAIALFGATSPHVPRSAARSVVVRGTITDNATHAPLEMARVVVEGNTVGANTNAAGEYVLKIQVGDRDSTVALRAMSIGYTVQARTVRLGGDTTRADFVCHATRVTTG